MFVTQILFIYSLVKLLKDLLLCHNLELFAFYVVWVLICYSRYLKTKLLCKLFNLLEVWGLLISPESFKYKFIRVSDNFVYWMIMIVVRLLFCFLSFCGGSFSCFRSWYASLKTVVSSRWYRRFRFCWILWGRSYRISRFTFSSGTL